MHSIAVVVCMPMNEKMSLVLHSAFQKMYSSLVPVIHIEVIVLQFMRRRKTQENVIGSRDPTTCTGCTQQ